MSEPKKKPKRKSSVAKKPKTHSIANKKEGNATTPETQSISKLDESKIEQLFQQTLLRYKQDLELDKKIKTKEMAHLSCMAEEFLSCFVLLGYSLQNERVVLWNAKSSKDEAAVIDLLRTTLIDVLGK